MREAMNSEIKLIILGKSRPASCKYKSV